MQVFPDLQLFTAPNPSPMTLQGTNSYLLGTTRFLLIDPGPLIPLHLNVILNYVRARGILELVLLTHHHSDHAESAEWLRRETGCEVGAFESSPVSKTRSFLNNETLLFDEISLLVLYSPGHTRDHLSFYWPKNNAIFSGDLVLGEGTTTLNPPDGNFHQYMESLSLLVSRDIQKLLPGHGSIGNAKDRIEETIKHRKMRHEQIKRCLAEGIDNPEKILKKIYLDTPAELLPYALGNIKAHLEALQ